MVSSHAATDVANHGNGQSHLRSPPLGFVFSRSCNLCVGSAVSRFGTGVEPATPRLSVWCSTTELTVTDVFRLEPMFGTVGTKPFRVTRLPLDGRHQRFHSKETPVGVEPTRCGFAGRRHAV
jgi:hypothetical protein